MPRILLMTTIVTLTVSLAGGAEYSTSVKPLPEGLAQANFNLFIPASVKAEDTIRGLIGVSKHEAGAQLYTDEGWCKLAEKHKLGVLMYELRQPQPPDVAKKSTANPRGQTTGIEAAAAACKTAMKDLAKQTSHPELEHACLIPTGLSRGGMQASLFAKTMPERIIGFVAIHGFAGEVTDIGKSPEARMVPGLATIGATDNLVSDRPFGQMLSGRAEGALWAAAIEPGAGHARNGDQTLPLLWAETTLEMRLPKEIAKDKPVKLNDIDPATGYLGELVYEKAGDRGAMTVKEVRIAPYKDFKGDKATAFWLPNEAVAKAWQAFCEGKLAPAPASRPANSPADAKRGAPAGGKGGKRARGGERPATQPAARQ